jgi:hypothetical protein
MASLEVRGERSRVAFRCGGRKFQHSPKHDRRWVLLVAVFISAGGGEAIPAGPLPPEGRRGSRLLCLFPARRPS